MPLIVEWYLEQIEALEDDCTDPGIRARIRWYINWVLAQGGPSHITVDQKREIYSAYLFNRDGRNKFAQSMIQPVQVRYKYYREILDTREQPFDWTWNRVLKGLQEAIVEYENFISIYPDGERFIPAVCEVRAGLVRLIALLEEVIEVVSGLDPYEEIPGVGTPLLVTQTSDEDGPPV